VWIETVHAWYILQKPSKRYNQHFRTFYKPLRIAQIVISAVVDDVDRRRTFEDFLASFIQHDISGGRTLVKDDLWAAVRICKAGHHKLIT
jgi:DNA (cytosine-5)-methyltransferase 1